MNFFSIIVPSQYLFRLTKCQLMIYYPNTLSIKAHHSFRARGVYHSAATGCCCFHPHVKTSGVPGNHNTSICPQGHFMEKENIDIFKRGACMLGMDEINSLHRLNRMLASLLSPPLTSVAVPHCLLFEKQQLQLQHLLQLDPVGLLQLKPRLVCPLALEGDVPALCVITQG